MNMDITGADLYGHRGTPWDDLPLSLLAGLPRHENAWHWGGPAPLTHRYAQLGRDECTADEHGVTWCYQTADNLTACSAAYIFVNNDPSSDPTRYDMEDALSWFDCAGRMGIVFG
jgi:hypothetical protein